MRIRLLFVVSLGLSLFMLPAVHGAREDLATPPASQADEPLPGVELARTVATATGIAITPLLGVSAVGAWQAYKAAPDERANLPWYASPWFWIPGIVIALLLVMKDPLLGLVPGAKKPLDALDVLENKASAILATPAIVPMFLSTFSDAEGLGSLPRTTSIALSEAGLAALPVIGEGLPQLLLVAIGVVVSLVAFFCVWLAFHAINVLILLSPFGPLDLLLRSMKLLVLALLVVSTFIHPYLGMLVALLIVLVSIPIAGWSFRFSVFGGVLATDLITLRHRWGTLDPARARGFTARKLGSVRPRTLEPSAEFQ